MKYNEKGQELLDDTPVEMPAGFRRPESIHEMIRRYVRSEQFAATADRAGVDTEDEANDFEIEDEEDDRLERFVTRHELSAMAAEELRELTGKQEFDKLRNAQLARYGEKYGPSKVAEGVGGAGRSGETGKGGDKPESSASAGDRKASSGVDESAGKQVGK